VSATTSAVPDVAPVAEACRHATPRGARMRAVPAAPSAAPARSKPHVPAKFTAQSLVTDTRRTQWLPASATYSSVSAVFSGHKHSAKGSENCAMFSLPSTAPARDVCPAIVEDMSQEDG